jgi:site-specific DNA-methyltransferase (adenine-specific)/modification methylase
MKKWPNNIYLGDCRVILRELPEGSIDLVFADPPYNLSGTGLKWVGNKTGGDWSMINEKWDKMSPEDYVEFTEDWIKQCWRALKGNGTIYISCTYHNLGVVLTTLKKTGFRVILWSVDGFYKAGC